MKKLLILGGSEFQIPLIKCAKRKGIYTIVVDISENAPARQYCDDFYKASLKDKNTVLQIAKEQKPDGITVGMVDIAIPTCAYVTKKMGLPGIDIDTAKKATDKYEMIKCFEREGVSHPKFQYVSHTDIDTIKPSISYPLIIKPIDMAGSRGIYLVKNDYDFKKAIRESSLVSDNGDLLIEEYMDGPEVSVEIIVKKGTPYIIQITDKTTSGAPHFAETGHLQPSQLSDEIKGEIMKVASAAAKSIGLFNSIAHAELKITESGPKMVEIGARSGGDGIAEQLIELSTGVSFSEIAIQLAFGEDFTIPKTKLNKSSCIRFIESKEGVFSHVDNFEFLNSICGVEEIKIYAKKGMSYTSMKDNSGRLGHVITSSDTSIDAKRICDYVINQINVHYKSEDEIIK